MTTPSILFVCVKNGGKSQMAAALARQLAQDPSRIHSAGTHPGSSVNALSRQVVEEVGATMDGEHTKGIDPDLLRTVDHVIVLGSEAVVDPVAGMKAEIITWHTDEPSERGVEGLGRMRLIREDIHARVRELLDRR